MFGPTLTPIDFAVAGGAGYDSDAQAYITAVEAADTESLETGVKDAINAFVVGCKADGIWDAIKAACIMAGARTLDGALVPLVGTAPDPYNFVSGDYSRTTGLIGNGSTKYLDSNRNNNADPQDDKHLSGYKTFNSTESSTMMGNSNTSGASWINDSTSDSLRVNGSSSSFTLVADSGFIGLSRSTPSAFTLRSGGSSTSINNTSTTPLNENIFIFAAVGIFSRHRLSFYSIGESLDLALLDSRVSTLMSQLTFAINTGLSPIGYSTETITYINAGYAAGGTLA